MAEPRQPAAFALREIESHLPTGWRLNRAGDAGRWDTKRDAWVVEVLDGADMDWPLIVPGDEIEKAGRLEALAAASRRLYREALG